MRIQISLLTLSWTHLLTRQATFNCLLKCISVFYILIIEKEIKCLRETTARYILQLTKAFSLSLTLKIVKICDAHDYLTYNKRRVIKGGEVLYVNKGDH